MIAFKAKGNMRSLQHIIYTDLNMTPDKCGSRLQVDAAARAAGVTVHQFWDLLGSAQQVELAPPQPHHCAVLMYTSGSTGKPKGIVCLHRNLVSLIGALATMVGIGEGESLVGYLPLAHIFEMQMEFFTFGYGGTIGYADPKTLTAGPGKCVEQLEGSAKIVMRGALEVFRPTLMGAVPKVWEVIMAGAEAKVKAKGGASVFLFNLALETKKKA
eukprot:gene40650-35831_t